MTRVARGRSPARRSPGPARACQSGLTLLELVISAMLGLLVLSGVFLAYVGSGTSDRQAQALARMTEDAQLALTLMSRELQMAGFMRIRSVADPAGGERVVVGLTANHRPVFGCDNGFSVNRADVAQAACEPPAIAPGIDMPAIEITHEVTGETTLPNSSGQPTDCLGNGATSVGDIVSNRFFVVRTGTGADTTYALHCASNVSDGQPLVSHVAALQFAYGFSPDWDRGMPSTWRPQRFVKASEVTDWARVVAVRVCLVMRSADPVLLAAAVPAAGANRGPSAADYIGCDGQWATSSDRHLYRVFKTTVTLRNQVA